METYKNLVKKISSVITVGIFDGVHLGHKVLLSRTVELARKNNTESGVITFFPYPEEVFNDASGLALTLQNEKEKLISDLYIDFLVTLNFKKALASMKPREFLGMIKILNPNFMVVGHDFKFGKKASGDIETVRKFFSGKAEVVEVPIFKKDGEPVKSSYIRRYLKDGKVKKAARFLGRSYQVEGRVVKGKGQGKRIGFKTANLSVSERKLIPGSGVYFGKATVKENEYPSAIFIPENSEEYKWSLEVFILDFEEEVYGENIKVNFIKKIREVRKYSSPKELSRQISRDIEKVRHLFLEGHIN